MKIKLKNADEFKTLLLRKGFTQSSLAKKAAVSNVYITRIVRGYNDPGPKVANSIVCALGCEFDDIFFIDHVCSSK